MTNLSKAQNDILTIINKNNGVTINELVYLTGYARNGITSRISELRKKGYDIKTNTKEVQAYFLFDENDNKIDYLYVAERITHYIAKNNLFGKTIDYPTLSRCLNISIKEIIGGVTILFNKYNVTQMSSTKIIIRR